MSLTTPADRKALVWLFLMLPVWGTTFPLMQIGIRDIASHLPPGGHPRIAPTLLLFLRFLIALPVILLLWRDLPRRLDRRTVRSGFLLSLPWYGGFILQIFGIQDSTPAISAFLTSLYVVVVPVISRILFREPMRGRVLVGIAVAVLGLGVMTDPFAGRFGWGEGLSALCAVSFAVHILLTDRLSREASAEGLTLGLMFWGSVYSLALLLVLPGGAAALAPAVLCGITTDGRIAANLAFLAVIASVLALYVVNAHQKSVTPARAALLYTLEPVFAAGFSWWLAQEELTAGKLAGGALILAGNFIAERTGRP